MKKTITLHAIDKKQGMTVAELKSILEGAPGESRVKVAVNLRGGIKTVEVILKEEL